MKKRAALVAAVITVLGLFTAPAASASCTPTPIEGMDGCMETTMCRALSPAEKVLGEGSLNCIM